MRSLVALGKEFGYAAFDLTTKNVRAQAYRDTRGPERDVMVVLLEIAKGQPSDAKAARDVAMFLLLGYGRHCAEANSLNSSGSGLHVLRRRSGRIEARTGLRILLDRK